MKQKEGQVWVETAIYTLIGITLIGIILATAMPQIEKMKDKAILEQTISAMQVLDSKMQEVGQTQGSVGKVSFKIAKGSLNIDSSADSIKYNLEDTKLEASEPGSEIQNGNLILKTEKAGSKFKISLTMNYTNFNLTYKNGETTKTINAGTTPYSILIENNGADINSKTQIDFDVI